MRYQDRIARALSTPGGHLAIGRGGFTLHHDDNRLSGYDSDIIKHEAIEAGLPVIDSRPVPYAVLARLAVEGPMVAVNRPAHPEPWHAFSDAPLAVVATAYRQVGADVHNIADEVVGHPCYGLPEYTYSDLERVVIRRLCSAGIAERLRAAAAQDREAIERALLNKLIERYRPELRPDSPPPVPRIADLASDQSSLF